jgi:hypothetical protein
MVALAIENVFRVDSHWLEGSQEDPQEVGVFILEKLYLLNDVEVGLLDDISPNTCWKLIEKLFILSN